MLEDIKYGLSDVDMDKINELLTAFDLDEKILKRCYIDLSSSEKKKILLIKLLIKDSKVLLLDDVTNGLDNKSMINLIKILKREKRNGKTIIVSSMDSDFLIQISDSFIILDNGKIKRSSAKYSVFTDKGLLYRIGMRMPSMVEFKMNVDNKKIKLVYRDNINDLIKDIYRNAEKKQYSE